jgi:hypothetical protein
MRRLSGNGEIRNYFPVFKTESKQFSAFRLNFAICNDNLQTLEADEKKDLDLSALRRQKGRIETTKFNCDT